MTEVYNISVANDGLSCSVLKNLSLSPSFNFHDNVIHSLTGLSSSLTGDYGFSGVI